MLLKTIDWFTLIQSEPDIPTISHTMVYKESIVTGFTILMQDKQEVWTCTMPVSL